MERPKPLLIVDWGRYHLGPRFTEVGTDRHWRRERNIWPATDVGYILHYPRADGTLIPFKWRVQRDLPRPKR